ncbi:MAG: alpha-amylase family glycosyl hydrolase, partial [Streptosporangiaceae bacterium]
MTAPPDHGIKAGRPRSPAEVQAEFEDVLRFWFDRGADGIRIDSAALLAKDAGLPEVSPEAPPGPQHPYCDRDDVHDIYRRWRAVADEYSGRVLIGEIWIPNAVRLARYVSPGELHTVFNFPYLSCPWDAAQLRAIIDNTLALNAPVGAPATWVPSNHDVDRIVTRLGRADTAFSLQRRSYYHNLPVDLVLVPSVPGPPRCSRWPCPDRSMCIRAKNSACGRFRTSRPTCGRIRSGSAAAARTPAETEAGCRCAGRARCRRSGSRRGTAASGPGCRSRASGVSSPSRRRPIGPGRCS